MADKALTVHGSVKSLLTSNAEAIKSALPEGFNFNRMQRNLLNALAAGDKISECTPESIMRSVVNASVMGLEVNTPTKEAYLIPRKDYKTKIVEAQFMPSYIGMIKIARRSGEIVDIYSEVVREGDHFIPISGSSRGIDHKPVPFSNKKVIGVYAVFTTTKGALDYEMMSVAEVDEIMKTSESYKYAIKNNKTNSVWHLHYNEMAKKTVLKRLGKRAPASIEDKRLLSYASEFDHNVAMGEPQDVDMIDLDIPKDVGNGKEARDSAAKERQDQLKEKLAEKKKIDEEAAMAESVEAEVENNEDLVAELILSYADYLELYKKSGSKAAKGNTPDFKTMNNEELIKLKMGLDKEKARLTKVIKNHEEKKEPTEDKNEAF